MGDALDLGADVREASFSPDRDYVLALLGEDRIATLLALRSRRPARALPDVAAGAERIYLSPEGSAAALYFAAANRLQVVSGLPDNPALAGEYFLTASPSAVAVSDDASSVLVADESRSVDLLLPDGARRRIGTGALVTFLSRNRDAVIGDPAQNRVSLVRDVNGSGETLLLASEREGLTEPVAVAASSDNALVFVATARSGVAAISVASGEITWTSCDCTPTAMSRLSGRSVFRLSEPTEGAPLWVYDGSGAEARVVFVPARRATVVETEGSVQ
jgi:DNA-binding beta-propeller fold protein YncE